MMTSELFGRKLYFVNQLLHSWLYNSFFFRIENVNHRFNYMYELIYFPSCEWRVLSYYIYIYIHLSNCALFGECIFAKNLLSFFISKLTEFSFKNLNLHSLEWWYHSDEAGHYNPHKSTQDFFSVLNTHTFWETS